jgi:elongation factor G
VAKRGKIKMKKYKVDAIRNIALLGHGASGKTTLAEAMNFNACEGNKMGNIDKGTTISDFSSEEKNRKFSISTSLIPVEWKNSKYNILDTPGYFDFVGEVFGSLRVAGGAVIVIDALSGIEVGTEKAWKFTEKRNMPKIIFVNKMDLENVNYVKIIKELKDRFGNKIAPFAIPNGVENEFTGFVNVVDLVGREYDGKSCVDVAITEELNKKVNPVRDMLIEAVAESDEDLLEKYFEGEEFTKKEIHDGLRKGVISGNIVPVIIGSAEKSIGIHTLMDMIYDYMPTPIDMYGGVYDGESPDNDGVVQRKIDENGPFSAFIFKTIVDPFVGKISLFKVYSGKVKKGDEVYNSTQKENEKIGKIFLVKGKEQVEVEEIVSGDIGAVSKLDYTKTGDTLCDKDNLIVYPGISIPRPAIFKAVKINSRDDESKLSEALHKLSDEDLSFINEWNPETKETLVGGQGTKQLTVIKSRLENEFDVKVTFDKPRVAYRETITKIASVEGKHKKQSGGSGQFGIVEVKFEPTSDGYIFESKVVGGSVPRQYIPAVEKGIGEALEKGDLAGYKVVNIKATLLDGKYHPVDSSEQAFKAAGRKALKAAYAVAKPILLEPIMHVEIFIPDENMGDIMGDMNKRRGRILGMEQDEKGYQRVIAEAPQSEMFEYLPTINSITKARGYFNMRFERYEEVPTIIAAKIISQKVEDEE